MNNQLLTQLLDLECSQFKRPIEIGETVALHDWGIKTHTNVIGYGQFYWDSNSRQIELEINIEMSKILIDDFKGLDIDRYDLFRTNPRKLTIDEAQYI